MKSQAEICSWRRCQRKRLANVRRAIGADLRCGYSARIEEALRVQVRRCGASSIGFYWPLSGEVDLRPFMRDFVERGGYAALPAVVERDKPLEFRKWWPGMPLYPDAHGVPAPKWRELVDPGVLLIPMLGFDQELHRLGFGTGYIDRTLAAFETKPFSIGISFELCSLDTIYPQPHDVPLDAIVTEDRVRTRSDREAAFDGRRATRPYASPPCYAAELNDEYGFSN